MGFRGSGLLTWSEISCDVENSRSFRSSRDCRVSQGHRLKGVAALHNYLAFIFHCRWQQSRERTRQVARSETFKPVGDLRYVRSPGDDAIAAAEAKRDQEHRKEEAGKLQARRAWEKPVRHST